MLNLLFELARLVGGWWSRTWRWVFRTRKNFFGALGVLAVSGLLWMIIGSALQPSKQEPEPTAESQGPRAPVYTEVKAHYIDASESDGIGGSEITEGIEEDPAEEIEESALEPPTFDSDSPESVSKGVVFSYVTRPSERWTGWEKWIEPHVMPELLKQLEGTIAHGTAAHDFPVEVTQVRLEEAGDEAPPDTPLRFSRTLVAQTAGGSGEGEVRFAVSASLGEDGWIVTEIRQVEE